MYIIVFYYKYFLNFSHLYILERFENPIWLPKSTYCVSSFQLSCIRLSWIIYIDSILASFVCSDLFNQSLDTITGTKMGAIMVTLWGSSNCHIEPQFLSDINAILHMFSINS